MGATATGTGTARSMFLSADTRKFGYTSKNGNPITLELRNCGGAESMQDVARVELAPTAVVETAEEQTKRDNPGPWSGLFDTLSFWVMEGEEIAAFGPYDEPVPT